MLARAHEQNDKGQGVETKIVSTVCAWEGGGFSPLSLTTVYPGKHLGP